MQENDLTQAEKYLSEGDHLDAMHVLYDIPREKTITAVNHVDTFMLTTEDLNKVLAHFPEVKEQMRCQGKTLYGGTASSMGAVAMQI